MRIWTLPTHPRIEQEPQPNDELRHNIFWYCNHCSARYAELRYADSITTRRWAAKAGICGNCSPDYAQLPGSIGWWNHKLGLPYEVLAYELDCEFRFLDSPYHPLARKTPA